MGQFRSDARRVNTFDCRDWRFVPDKYNCQICNSLDYDRLKRLINLLKDEFFVCLDTSCGVYQWGKTTEKRTKRL